MLNNFIIIVAVAISYYFYHWNIFDYMCKVFQKNSITKSQVIITFVVNYIWFTVASILMLHLIINWTLFYFFLLLEILLVYKSTVKESMMMSLFVIIIGLASTLFMRGIFALVLNKPVAAFDNRTGMAENFKRYPLLIGFFLAGAILLYYKKKRFNDSIRLVFSDLSSLHFSLVVQCMLYLYLTLNLMTHYVLGNSAALKIWELKSAIFAILGSNICGVYAVRMSQLNLYRRKLQQDRKDMLNQKEEQEQVWMLAFTDSLTGCYNRYYLEELLQDYCEEGISYCLCFIDIDRLKYVNDKFGHFTGDLYLKTVADLLKNSCRNRQDTLFRYGGDEVILRYRDIAADTARERMQNVNDQLAQKSRTKDYPFPMSISFGIAKSQEADTGDALLTLADQRMYRQKTERGMAR